VSALHIVGPSRSGKSTLARALCEQYGLDHISASAWARQWCGVSEDDPHFRVSPQLRERTSI
jgi:adenylate kinase family enzyme